MRNVHPKTLAGCGMQGLTPINTIHAYVALQYRETQYKDKCTNLPLSWSHTEITHLVHRPRTLWFGVHGTRSVGLFGLGVSNEKPHKWIVACDGTPLISGSAWVGMQSRETSKRTRSHLAHMAHFCRKPPAGPVNLGPPSAARWTPEPRTPVWVWHARFTT